MWSWFWEIIAGIILGTVAVVALYVIAGVGWLVWEAM